MRLILTVILTFSLNLSFSQSYINLSKEDIIAIKGNSFNENKSKNSITYIVDNKSSDGIPTLPNAETFYFNNANNVITYINMLNEVPQSIVLKIIAEFNEKYEKVNPENDVKLKWVDKKNLLIIRMLSLSKGYNNLYSLYYQINKVEYIE